jgi:hypothetical protein
MTTAPKVNQSQYSTLIHGKEWRKLAMGSFFVAFACTQAIG